MSKRQRLLRPGRQTQVAGEPTASHRELANSGFEDLPGERFYREIIAADPAILDKHRGEEIWIDPDRREYEIGNGITACNRLLRRIGRDHGPHLYSRKIGQLDHLLHFADISED